MTGAFEVFIIIMALMLYANTLTHDFTQDDAIVIYNNIYVQEGFDGIIDIFSKDSFSGFFGGEDKSNLVTGGRYRPLSIAIFACLYEIVGPQQIYFHLLAMIIYAFVCLALFKVIVLAGTSWPSDKRKMFAFVATLVFLVHPIHTEVVANVKGLDESFSLLFGLLATFFALKGSSEGKHKYTLITAIFFLMAILSKENAAAFLIVIPLTLYGFTKPRKRLLNYLLPVLILIIAFGGYWLLRDSIIGSNLTATQSEMLNNPFIKIEDGRYIPFTTGEKWASICLGMGKYIQLLVFPHPLTHDYYPRHFAVVNFQNASVLMSLIMNALLVTIAILGIRKKSFVSFCILLFYITIGLTSNVLFPIGTHLSERFLFTPSIALALLVAYGYINFNKELHRKSVFSIILGALLLISGYKTMLRSQVWKNDFTLFTTDVHISKNSAKVRNAAGGALLDASLKETGVVKSNMIKEAVVHLNRAIEIHPNYKGAFLLLGNGYLYQKDYPRSINAYSNALKINPYYDQASKNLLISLREGAKKAGGIDKDFAQAINYLNRALEISPNDFEATALMGTAHGSTGDHAKAIRFYTKAIRLNPEISSTYVNLGLAQLNAGLEEEAQNSFNKAVQIDPGALDKIRKSN